MEKYSSYKYDPKQLQLRANDESGLPWESARTGSNNMNVSNTVLVYEAQLVLSETLERNLSTVDASPDAYKSREAQTSIHI